MWGLIELIDATRVGTTIHGFTVHDAGVLPHPDARAVVALGKDRAQIWETLASNGWVAATVVHPRAYLSPTVEIAQGCIVSPAVVIGAHSSLAAHTLVGAGALIGHHVKIGVGAVINRGSNVAGNSRVGDGATIGMGATIINGMSIGDRATVAAGSVVVRDVRDGIRVQGVRAREYSVVGADG